MRVAWVGLAIWGLLLVILPSDVLHLMWMVLGWFGFVVLCMVPAFLLVVWAEGRVRDD